MTETKKKPESILRLTVVLLAVSAITALVLGLVNHITADRIKELSVEKTNAAMNEVLPYDGNYEEIDYTGGDARILNAYKAGDKGYVFTVEVSGSQGMVDMVVGVDNSGAVTGISITKHSETSGLGANAAAGSDVGVNFRNSFVGAAGSVAVTKDGGTIDALTGATVTSRAVCDGVNAALDAFGTLQ